MSVTNICDSTRPSLDCMDLYNSPCELKNAIRKHFLASFPLRVNASANSERLLEAVNKVRSEAAKSPSMGIALTMHMHIVIACHRHPNVIPEVANMLDDVVSNEALVASAFAEGVPGQDVFSPSLTYEWASNSEIFLAGTKRPCSLASIADYFVASCKPLVGDGSSMRLALARSADVEADQTFWCAPYLVAADTNAVVFRQAKISPAELSVDDSTELEAVLAYGMSVFNLLACASYTGVLDRAFDELPDRCFDEPELAMARVEFNLTSQALLHSIAKAAERSNIRADAINDVLVLRYQYEELIDRMRSQILNRAGGIAILSRPILLQLLNIAGLLKYHPIARSKFLTSMLNAS